MIIKPEKPQTKRGGLNLALVILVGVLGMELGVLVYALFLSGIVSGSALGAWIAAEVLR